MIGALQEDSDLVRSFDGSMIAAHATGSGEKMPMLIANPVGATLGVWRKVLADIGRQRQAITWDHRGLHASSKPASDRIDVGAHAEDAIAVLDHLGIDEFVLLSWSNGSRIALELTDRYPERVRALSIVCGGFGQSFGRLVRYLELASLLPAAARIAKHFAPRIEGPLDALVTRPELAGLIRQSGFVGATADVGLLVELLREIAACDAKALLATFEAVAGDAAPELVSTVEAPTLLIAGDRDKFTPLRMMEEMNVSIAGSELIVYERATHYLPIEYPARLADDLRLFFP